MYCDDTEWVEMTYKAPILPDSSTDFFSYLEFFKNGLKDIFVNTYHQFFVQADAVVASEYIANAVNYDGVSDYLEKNSTLTGVSDTKQITGSFWINFNTVADTMRIVLTDSGNFEIR